ncbi:DUF4382 domain-containing protein [Alicycliphilus denitrificans]|uniref:DUF4382 domain-containing protein n=1 Tax=Alicycliphilus denitrificans TaxID=179636 RepID=UPI0038513CB9
MRNARAIWPAKALGWSGMGLIAAGLAACGGGGGGDNASQQGSLKLAMTDAPACGYDHVYVTVTKIRVHQSASADSGDAGWSELLIPPRRIDLFGLTNGVLQELGTLPLPAGNYQQIRLVLADNPSKPTPANPLANALVPLGSTNEIALTTPSGQQSGFKLKANFNVTGGQVADMVLDFDACKSIVKAGNSGNYNLKPVVAVIKRLTTEIVGYVDPALASSVVVSTRDPDNNLRATVPNATTGKFVLAYLPEHTNYTVVVAGQNLTTAAVTGVPVSIAAGTTTLNTPTTPIPMLASASAIVSGTVTNASNTPLTDAAVNAQQVLSAGQKLDVAWTLVDPTNASYSLALPLVAPNKAPYVANGPLMFTADTAVAGQYNILGSATGYTIQNTAPAVTLTTPNSVTTKKLELAP